MCARCSRGVAVVTQATCGRWGRCTRLQAWQAQLGRLAGSLREAHWAHPAFRVGSAGACCCLLPCCAWKHVRSQLPPWEHPWWVQEACCCVPSHHGASTAPTPPLHQLLICIRWP
jgi:hypothetical protein